MIIAYQQQGDFRKAQSIRKSPFFKNFRNNSKFRDKFNFSRSSVRKTIFRESHGSSGRFGRTDFVDMKKPSAWLTSALETRTTALAMRRAMPMKSQKKA